MCDEILKVLGAHLFTSTAVPQERDTNVKCRTRVLILFALVIGLLSTGTLSIAIATDYWIYTNEPYILRQEFETENATMLYFHINAGLWRGCYITTEIQGSHFALPRVVYVTLSDASLGADLPLGVAGSFSIVINTLPTPRPGQGPLTQGCFSISYKATYRKVHGDSEMMPETSWAILRGIRKAAPMVVTSLLVLITGLLCCTLGNTRNDNKTLIGAVLYIFGALGLALGVILYISAVNDEIAHRKKPENPEIPMFTYTYGWAFFFAGSSFITSMSGAVANITLFLKRYNRLEDMVSIIPGLEEKSNFSLSREVETQDESLDYECGSQNPTIIL